jgi:hypothetical protein
VHFFYSLPCRLTDALAMSLWIDEQYFQFTLRILLVNLKNKTTDNITITDDTIGLSLIPIYATLRWSFMK